MSSRFSFTSGSSENESLINIRKREDEILKLQIENDKKLREIQRRSQIENLSSVHEKAKESIKYLAEDFKDNFGKNVEKLASSLQSSLSGQLDSTINSYINNYQSMISSLVGANKDWESITDNLNNALSANSLVRQENVYKNLTELIKAGISENVEQRAFLETISDDLNLLLDTQTGSLARLIRLQDASIAENRVAIEYSLREFLNQNYQTSEYIKDSYLKVADSISELQAISTTSLASSIESALQTWLGSYYSVGVSDSTISNLASAINSLGTGDLSNINSNISKLVMMGAATSGKSYGDLLTNGITAEDVSAIMSGITDYAKSIEGNNVVRSQWASLFGLSISDLEALKNLNIANNTQTVSSDINKLFDAYANFVPTTVGLKNTFENLMFTTATNIASNDALYGSYFVTDILEKSGIGSALSSLGSSIASMGLKKTGGALQVAGTAINYSKLIPYLGGLLSTVIGDNALGNLGDRNSVSSAYANLGGTLVADASAGSSVTMTPKVNTSLGADIPQATEAAGDETSTDEFIKTTSETTSLIYEAVAGDVGNSIKDILIDIRNNMTSGSTGIGMQSSWAYTQI